MRLVNLTKRVMVNGGLRYCPVVEAANGRIRPDVVMVDGTEERHPEGCYYIDYREGEKRVRSRSARMLLMPSRPGWRSRLNCTAVKAGLEILNSPVMIGGQAKHSLAAAIASYLEDVKLSKKPKTYSRILNRTRLFRRVLPQAVRRGYRPERHAEIFSVPPRRERPVTPELSTTNSKA